MFFYLSPSLANHAVLELIHKCATKEIISSIIIVLIVLERKGKQRRRHCSCGAQAVDISPRLRLKGEVFYKAGVLQPEQANLPPQVTSGSGVLGVATKGVAIHDIAQVLFLIHDLRQNPSDFLYHSNLESLPYSVFIFCLYFWVASNKVMKNYPEDMLKAQWPYVWHHRSGITGRERELSR